MKILKVTVENFKPFVSLQIPENNSFMGEGLFLICGDNSMGKTSFIESLLWGLLGDSMMDVHKKEMLVRTGQSNCKVDILFDLGGSQYRIIRKLTLKKSNSKKNQLDFYPDAVLSKKIGDKFVPIVSRPNAVNKEVESMLGLTADAMLKTVYIRQKEVDKLALAEPKELRDLVTTLFGLDEFNRVKNDIAKICSDLQDCINMLKGEVGSLISESTEYSNKRQELEQKEHDFRQKKYELQGYENDLSNLPTEHSLTEIKNIQNNINTKSHELEVIDTAISEKTKYHEDESYRIENLTKSKEEWEIKSVQIEKELMKYPSKKHLKILQESYSKISLYEELIRDTINGSMVKPDFDPILAPEQIRQLVASLVKEKDTLRKRKQAAERTFNLLDKLLISNETLSGIKKNSVKYIEEKNNCPVCNKPIDNKERMVSDINQVIIDIDKNNSILKDQVETSRNEYANIEREIKRNDKLTVLLNTLSPSIDGLITNRNTVQSLLTDLSAKDLDDFLSRFGFSTINEMFSKVEDLESNFTSYQSNIGIQEGLIRRENHQLQKCVQELSNYENQRRPIMETLDKLKTTLDNSLSKLSANSLSDLVSRYKCVDIDELASRRESLALLVVEKKSNLKAVKLSLSSLKNDIHNREQRIEHLKKKEAKLHKKENTLRHAKYLKGEIDGFISNYVVEGKMAEMLRLSTNAYLDPFTSGRYTINRISSTMRRLKGMESHGLEIILMDNKDNIVKTKDQLSGGDETALGLALRIAISKLMAKIRPFKDAERRPPLINSIIMDEPLASLDSSRRHTLMDILTQDKSFSQIFLVTHTDAEIGDCHSIIMDEDASGKRLINYKPIQL